jgi:hypothetical protein
VVLLEAIHQVIQTAGAVVVREGFLLQLLLLLVVRHTQLPLALVELLKVLVQTHLFQVLELVLVAALVVQAIREGTALLVDLVVVALAVVDLVVLELLVKVTLVV